jgi:hypothetical protein
MLTNTSVDIKTLGLHVKVRYKIFNYLFESNFLLIFVFIHISSVLSSALVNLLEW